MVGKPFPAADRRELRRPTAGSRRCVSLQPWRLNLFLAFWLLGGVTLLTVFVCSTGQAEQSTPNGAVRDEIQKDQIRDCLRAVEKALFVDDWDTAISSARSVLRLDPGNVAAKELQWQGLTGPLPEEREGHFKYKVVQGGVVISSCGDQAAEVTIPAEIAGKPVVRIGECAFLLCHGMNAVTIPDSVASIGSSAFSCRENLRSVTIGDSVAHISPGAFGNCETLTYIAVAPDNASFRSIDGILFSKNGKTILAFPAGKKVAEYTIPDSVTRIGNNAFEGCKNLRSVAIGDSVTSIGGRAFYFCTNLTTIAIPDSVTNVGADAFSVCMSLAAVSIPDSVTRIGEGTFSGCGSLKAVTIPDSVTNVGAGAFAECKSLNSITVEQGNTSFRSTDGVFFSSDGKIVLAFPAGKKTAEYTIPDSVTRIGSQAFFGCART